MLHIVADSKKSHDDNYVTVAMIMITILHKLQFLGVCRWRRTFMWRFFVFFHSFMHFFKVFFLFSVGQVTPIQQLYFASSKVIITCSWSIVLVNNLVKINYFTNGFCWLSFMNSKTLVNCFVWNLQYFENFASKFFQGGSPEDLP